jgi:hypothetical protein
MGIYLGNNWFIQSSDQGVTIVPFTDWYAHPTPELPRLWLYPDLPVV